MRKTILSAVTVTNRLQLGNYLGALKNWAPLQSQYECFFFAADLHALTTVNTKPGGSSAGHLLEQTLVNIATYIACGIDPENEKRVQSDEDKPFEGVPIKGEEKIIIRNINFAFDRYDKVIPGGKEILKQLAEYLQKPPVLQKLIIEGHTDGLGSEEYNLKLSENRAAQIKKYLVVVHGIDEKKIETRGYGLSRPVASNANYQGRRLNRRVEFIILR